MTTLQNRKVAVVGAGLAGLEVSYVNRWDYVCAITYPGFFTRVRDFVAAHRKDQPIHYAGDYIVLGMEGATTSGLNAARQVKQYLRSTDRERQTHDTDFSL